MPANSLPRKAYGIIPARYGSTRFPGKALTLLNGKPMFYHVWQRASLCPDLSSVTLATDDPRIATAAAEYNIPCLMTAKTHESGTDRVHEAAQLLNLTEDSLVVNIQGDEPALNPAALSELVLAFEDPAVEVATLAHKLSPADLHNPDKVKVVLDINRNALYFSRAPIPFCREPLYNGSEVQEITTALGHVGLYAFSMRSLASFVALPPSSLEQIEKLEQLRLLENNIPIRVVITEYQSHGVDTPEDAKRVLAML